MWRKHKKKLLLDSNSTPGIGTSLGVVLKGNSTYNQAIVFAAADVLVVKPQEVLMSSSALQRNSKGQASYTHMQCT